MHIESRALVIYHSLSHLKPYHLMMSNQLISRDSNMSIYVYERFVIPHIMRMSVCFYRGNLPNFYGGFIIHYQGLK